MFAIEGKEVAGYVQGNNIAINVDSSKALNTVVGHEITHIFEGTELYPALQEAVKVFADSKGEYEGKLQSITKMYEGIEGANIDNELTAELVGEYLFSDTEFIKKLSVEQPNAFQKIYDEIKYLCKVATAGSKEAKEFEKVKKTFAEAYRQKNNTATDEGVRYSVTNKVDDSKAVVRIINDNISKITNESHFSVESEKLPDGVKPSDYIFNIFVEQGGKAINEELGIIDLSRSGAKSTALHGFGNNKLAAVKAIQNVIEKGTIINKTENYNGTEVDRYTIAAKGTIDGKSAIVGVVVKAYPKNKNSNAKFYLHEAIIKETDSPFRTAPQLSVDTVSESVSNNSISNPAENVKENDTKYSLSGIDEAVSFVENEIRGEDIKLQQSEASIINGDEPVKETTSAEIKNDNTIQVPDITVGDEEFTVIDEKENVIDNDIPTAKKVVFNEDESTEKSIKNQLKENLEKLNSMNIVASLKDVKKFKSKQDVIEWAMSKLQNTGFKVNRSGFGEIIFDRKRIQNGLRYLKTNEERIAYAFVPQVLTDGTQIGYHPKHKGRDYDTITFAAPVEINGVRGNMAVVVRSEGKNYYKVHRLVLPDGSQFSFNKKGDIAERAGGVENNSSLSPTDNISINIVPNTEQKVNENAPKTRKELHSNIIDRFKSAFIKNNLDFDKTLNTGKRHSVIFNNDNTPQRLLEKTFGTKAGKLLADLTVNKIAQNETEGIKWLNSITGKGGLLRKISKEYKTETERRNWYDVV